MNKRVAIILVNWNSFEVTCDCISSLLQSDYPFFEIVVVDNASADDSVTRLREKFPSITVLASDTNTGFSGGNNIGLRYALGKDFEYSIMLNNDTFAEPDFLGKLVRHMDEDPTIGVIQPRIHFQHDRNLLWDAGSYYNKWLGYLYTKGLNQPVRPEYLSRREVDWITGCAFFTRNEILRQTGLLADNMFMYSEDADLSFRISALGYRLVYDPSAVIYHIAGMAGKSQTKGKEGFVNPLVHYLNQRNRIWLLKKYTPWYCVPTAIAFNFCYILIVMGYFALRGRFSKLKAVGRAFVHGLTGSIKNESEHP